MRLEPKHECCWTTLIQAYVARGDPEGALHLFQAMQDQGVQESRFTHLALLRASVMLNCLETGRLLHAFVITNAFDKYSFVGNALVGLYAKCGSIIEAENVFNKLPMKSTVSWNALLTAYAARELCDEALDSLRRMQLEGFTRDSITFVCVLKACRGVNALEVGREIFSMLVREGFDDDLFVSSTLVDMHVKCDSIFEAWFLLDRQPHRDVVSWTALIKGFVDIGCYEEALSCLHKMRLEELSPNSVTLIFGLKACGIVGHNALGINLHNEVILKGFERDRFLGSGLIDMYARCSCFIEAHHLFEKLPVKTVVSWSALIAGYAENGLGIDALIQLEGMHMEGMPVDALIVSSSLKACGSIKDSKRGKELHALVAVEGFESDAIVGSALVGMYAKCGLLDEALETFEELPIQGVASWTALIGGYADQDLGDRAISFFEEMQEESVSPDVVTYVCGLKAYAAVGASDGGKKAHSELLKRGLERDTAIANTLVDLYAKCGLLGEAQNVFTKLSNQSVVSWTALIAGYAYEGKIELVLQMLDSMVEHGLQPNDTTFIPVLAVCSHAGIVEVGLKALELMSGQYGITPRMMHYNCVVDLIGRAGQIYEALWILGHTPSPPNLVSWKTLMGACRKSCDVGLGRHVFNCALWMEMQDPELFVSMYNIYGDSGLWAEAEGIVALRNELMVV